MKKSTRKLLILLTFLLLILIGMQEMIQLRSKASVLKKDGYLSPNFREQALGISLYENIRTTAKTENEFSEILTCTMLNGRYFPKKMSFDSEAYLRFKGQEYTTIKDCYAAIWLDLETFPIPKRTETKSSDEIFYENSFGAVRNFNGKRVHEGCDLFGKISVPGYYPIISMTSGTVEKIGWLPLGGYRIGIRAPHGGYFYYAHLQSYEKEFQAGDEIQAGEILGYMGNTGYGEEGTTGRFPVHLHLGIYFFSPEGKEISVNPYHILQAMAKKAKKYTY